MSIIVSNVTSDYCHFTNCHFGSNTSNLY